MATDRHAKHAIRTTVIVRIALGCRVRNISVLHAEIDTRSVTDKDEGTFQICRAKTTKFQAGQDTIKAISANLIGLRAELTDIVTRFIISRNLAAGQAGVDLPVPINAAAWSVNRNLTILQTKRQLTPIIGSAGQSIRAEVTLVRKTRIVLIHAIRIPTDLTRLAVRIPNALHIITRIRFTTAQNKTQDCSILTRTPSPDQTHSVPEGLRKKPFPGRKGFGATEKKPSSIGLAKIRATSIAA